MITIDDFGKVEMQVGLVTAAENLEKSEKLIRLHVRFGSEERIIFTGVRTYGYGPEDFVNNQFLFATNLEPKKMLGEESQGMILAVDGAEGKPVFINGNGLPEGAKVR